jgi:hypothetical protein
MFHCLVGDTCVGCNLVLIQSHILRMISIHPPSLSVLLRIPWCNGTRARYIDTIPARTLTLIRSNAIVISSVDVDIMDLRQASSLAVDLTCFISYLFPPSLILRTAPSSHLPRYSNICTQCQKQFPDRGHRVSPLSVGK